MEYIGFIFHTRDTHEERPIKRLIRHPAYDGSALTSDIALVEIEPLTRESILQLTPVCTNSAQGRQKRLRKKRNLKNYKGLGFSRSPRRFQKVRGKNKNFRNANNAKGKRSDRNRNRKHSKRNGQTVVLNSNLNVPELVAEIASIVKV